MKIILLLILFLLNILTVYSQKIPKYKSTEKSYTDTTASINKISPFNNINIKADFSKGILNSEFIKFAFNGDYSNHSLNFNEKDYLYRTKQYLFDDFMK